MNVNIGVPSTVDDHGALLGVSADRVCLSPSPGSATFADFVEANESGDALYELAEGTLVEKAMSYEASIVAITIARILSLYVSTNKLGLVSGANGFFRLPSAARAPDVAFMHRNRLPDGAFPKEPYPKIAPNLVVEVLSPGNTKQEMARKRLEYFSSDVELVWIVDCVHQTVAVYSSTANVVILGETDTIDGGDVLPEFTSPVADFFADLDIGNSAGE